MAHSDFKRQAEGFGEAKMADSRLRRTFGFYPANDPDTTVSTSLKISFDECYGSQKGRIFQDSLHQYLLSGLQ